MKRIQFHRYGRTDAINYATTYLSELGYTFLPCPTPDVSHLLLPVPSFDPDGTVKGGEKLDALLEEMPKTVTIVGGNLDHPLLSDYKKIDLLKDEQYLADNAAITAHCALKVALRHSRAILPDCRILIIGWGRIGKCFSALLKNLGCTVTVATRKSGDRAILSAMGYQAEDSRNISGTKYDIIFNTSPEPVVTVNNNDTLAIELASTPGLIGENIISARGLPAKEAPVSSGKLIAQTIHRIIG